ncbi:ROK family protein [Clostridium sp. C105KSO13]|uniref:ROK family protein n=1 Tax=Clostridium sp. C105KSO13 TaxID=1776045 RepID=UPI00074064D9|nr:ROK family transcriptional regulator [Clostridium sp. C105KSO13]CUX37925.1 N-acetylmannosamine kinase [Clostridium sp. C105KSO13]
MSRGKISPNVIKLNNRQSVYQYIRKNDSVSKQDIVVALQLSLPTVTQNLQYLEKQKLIDTSRKIKNTGGRNATAYTYIENAKMAIGVYITVYHINAVAVDLSGDIKGIIRERVPFNLDDDEYLKKIGRAVEIVKAQAGISDKDILGVGIGVPGLVSDDGENVLYGMTLNFTGKTRKEIAKYIPYNNRLLHDSYAAGYAEIWEDHRVKNGFYISLSNSVGGSIIIDQTIYEGDRQKGGEIGHMVVVPKGGEKCYCGRYGCFDTVCRACILDQYTGGNLEEFFVQLKKGDREAAKLWDEYLDNLAIAVHNMRILFDGVIIVGGYVGAYIGDYMEDLCDRVDRHNPFGDSAKDYLFQCRFKREATAAGAALFYIDEFLNSV